MKLQKTLIALLILLIPVVVFVLWKSKDLNYPTNDEAAYFDLTQKLYLNFEKSSSIEATVKLYTERYWKPILHPALGVGFLGLAGGDSRLAISFYGGAMYLVLLLGVFFYIKRHTNTMSAALGAATLSLLPWVFGMSTTFNSEIGFSAVAIWLYYHAENFSDFSDLKKSLVLAVLLFLLFILRPVEAALLSAVWLLYLIGKHLKNKKISFIDLLIVVLWVSVFVTATIFPFFILKKHWTSLQMWVFAGIGVGVLALSVLAVLFGKAHKGFQVFVSSFFFLSLLWYIPGSYELFDWIYITNFDYLAKATGNRLGRPAAEFILFYLKKWGWLPVALLVVYVLENRAKIFSKRGQAVGFLLAAIVLFPSLGGLFSYNGDVRYYYAGWLVFTAVLLAEFMKKEGSIRMIKAAVMAAFIGAFSFGLLKYDSVRDTWFQKYFHMLGGESFFLMVPNKEDLPAILEEKTSAAIHEKYLNQAHKNIHYFQTAVHPFFDSNSVNIIARERGNKVFFTTRSLYEPLQEKDILDAISYSDFVLVGSVFAEQQVSSNSEARNKLADFCKSQADAENIFAKQLRLHKEIINEAGYWPAARFCLFEVLK